MGVYSFLATLPALLGVTGFFAYLWFGQARIGGDLFKAIIEKLRTNPNVSPRDYASMTPARIAKLVQVDASVRNAVNDEDGKLLRLLIKFQYATTFIVFLTSAGLVAWSVWLVSRPQPLSLVLSAPKATVAQAQGLLVDLDPLSVEWTATGKEEQLSVFLENVDSQQRSAKRIVRSNVRSVVFDALDVLKVATDRGYRRKNRIRSVVEWPGGTAYSEPQDVHVGIDVELMLYGRLVGATEDRTIHTLFATIDRSTENLPRDYCFMGEFVCFTKSGATVVPLRSCASDGEVKIPMLDSVNWDRPFGFSYDGPDDPRIVRSTVTGMPSPTESRPRPPTTRSTGQPAGPGAACTQLTLAH